MLSQSIYKEQEIKINNKLRFQNGIIIKRRIIILFNFTGIRTTGKEEMTRKRNFKN